MTDVRNIIVGWAHWALSNKAHFNYSEGSDRMSAIGKPGVLPVTCDCSAFVTVLYNWAGAPDPNGLHYDHEGFTGTLLQHGLTIPEALVKVGDVVVLGNYPGVHAALIVETGPDPMTISHGQQGDPSLVPVSVLRGLGQPTFLRFPTEAVNPIHTLVDHKVVATAPKPAPKPVPDPAPVVQHPAQVVQVVQPVDKPVNLIDHAQARMDAVTIEEHNKMAAETPHATVSGAVADKAATAHLVQEIEHDAEAVVRFLEGKE